MCACPCLFRPFEHLTDFQENVVPLEVPLETTPPHTFYSLTGGNRDPPDAQNGELTRGPQKLKWCIELGSRKTKYSVC